MTTDVDASKIAGNVSDDIKKIVGDFGRVFYRRSFENDFTGRIFGGLILSRTRVTEASVLAKAEEPEKLECRVVCELDVEEGEQISVFAVFSLIQWRCRYDQRIGQYPWGMLSTLD